MKKTDCYFLTSARIGFSVWQDDDLELANSLWGEPAVTRFICAKGRFSPEEIGRRLALEVGTQRAHGVQYWPCFLLDGGDFIGCCGLRPYGDGPHVFELGFHLKHDFWGCGYATEAASAVMAHAVGALGAQALYAGHHPENSASSHVLQKLGFQCIGQELYSPTGLQHPLYRWEPAQARPSQAEPAALIHMKGGETGRCNSTL